MSITNSNTVVAVMSYNRGEYLKNCISSIEKNSFFKEIRIYDDGSNDKKTVSILSDFSKKYTVYINKKETKNELGGIHVNTNKALSHAIRDGFEYIFFIHDDVQIVRKCDDHFLNECDRIFSSNNKLVQIIPVFFKGNKSKEYYLNILRIDNNFNYYTDKKLSGIADMGITRISEIKKENWSWNTEIGEAENMKIGAKLGWFYVKAKNPIMIIHHGLRLIDLKGLF